MRPRLTETSAPTAELVGGDRQRHLLVVPDHRGSKALAELREIGPQVDIAGAGGGELTLHSSDRHHPLVGVPQVHPRLVGADVAGALQQDGGDDLQAVCDPVLDLLQQDAFFA